MTPDEILEVDARRNYPPGTTAGNLRAIINEEARNRAAVVQQGDTLITFKTAGGDENVEFHTFNADTPENLANNVLMFFGMVKKMGYKTASTSYENPKISALFQKFVAPKYKVNIGKQDGQYIAKVRL